MSTDVRGKAGKPVEFGAKPDIRVVRGWTRLEYCSFDAHNEAGNLQDIARFTNAKGIIPSAFSRTKHTATVRSLGYENARFHDLRHSYAVAAIESGDDIKTVQTNLGHATASFILDVYGHASQKMKQQSADRMERYIMEVLNN